MKVITSISTINEVAKNDQYIERSGKIELSSYHMKCVDLEQSVSWRLLFAYDLIVYNHKVKQSCL